MNHSLTISMCGTGTSRSSSSSCCNELECTSSHLKIENYNFWIHNTSISLTCHAVYPPISMSYWYTACLMSLTLRLLTSKATSFHCISCP